MSARTDDEASGTYSNSDEVDEALSIIGEISRPVGEGQQTTAAMYPQVDPFSLPDIKADCLPNNPSEGYETTDGGTYQGSLHFTDPSYHDGHNTSVPGLGVQPIFVMGQCCPSLDVGRVQGARAPDHPYADFQIVQHIGFDATTAENQ